MRINTVLRVTIAFGLSLRVLGMLVQGVPYSDGSVYAVMGASFAAGKEFTLPWVANPGPLYGPELSHHFAPMWPLVLGLAYAVAGFSIATTMAVSLLVSLLLVLVVFLTTRDLMGTEKAYLVTAVVALDYGLIELTGYAYSENLLTLFYVGTIWAILRSLKDERYVILAGLFAGAGYLTKASVGYFFVLAGGLGFLWRFYYMRWNVFRSRSYMLAIGVFLAFVGTWALRNINDFGWPHWETSPYTNFAIAHAFSVPLPYVPALIAKVALFLIFFSSIGLFLAPQIILGIRRWKVEEVSALLLAVTLPALLGVIFAAAFSLIEPYATLWWSENRRYIVMAFVPLLWLALREVSLPIEGHLSLRPLPTRLLRLPPRSSILTRALLIGVAGFTFYEVDRMTGLVVLFGAVFGPRLLGQRVSEIRVFTIVALVVALGLVSVNAATAVLRSPEYDAGPFLARIVHPGDVIAVTDGVDVNELYPSLRNSQIELRRWDGSGNTSSASFLLTTQAGSYIGYGLLATFNWTKTPGLIDQAYFSISRGIRSFLGVPTPARQPSPGDLFLYRSNGSLIPRSSISRIAVKASDARQPSLDATWAYSALRETQPGNLAPIWVGALAP